MDYGKFDEDYLKRFKFKPVNVSVIYSCGKPVKYFINEISENTGVTTLRLNQWAYIVTTACDSPDEIIDLLEYVEFMNHAIEIEV